MVPVVSVGDASVPQVSPVTDGVIVNSTVSPATAGPLAPSVTVAVTVLVEDVVDVLSGMLMVFTVVDGTAMLRLATETGTTGGAK